MQAEIIVAISSVAPNMKVSGSHHDVDSYVQGRRYRRICECSTHEDSMI